MDVHVFLYVVFVFVLGGLVTAEPVASPRLSGNHFDMLLTGETYDRPAPQPPAKKQKPKNLLRKQSPEFKDEMQGHRSWCSAPRKP